MPKYVLPAFDEGEKREIDGATPVERILYIPVNEDILEGLKLDEKVEVKMLGQVVGLESSDLEYGGQDFKFKVETVEVYPEMNEFGKLAMDDDEDE